MGHAKTLQGQNPKGLTLGWACLSKSPPTCPIRKGGPKKNTWDSGLRAGSRATPVPAVVLKSTNLPTPFLRTGVAICEGVDTCSRNCIFFLLTLSLLWSSLFYSPLLSASAQLCFSSVHIVGSLTSKLPSVIIYYYIHMRDCFCLVKWRVVCPKNVREWRTRYII